MKYADVHPFNNDLGRPTHIGREPANRACAPDHFPLPVLDGLTDAARVVDVLVRHDDRTDLFRPDAGDGESRLDRTRAQSTVDEDAGHAVVDENRVATAAAAERDDAHQWRRRDLAAPAARTDEVA